MTKQRLYFLFVIIHYFIWANAQTSIYTFNGRYKIELPTKLELQFSEFNTIKRVCTQNKKHQFNIANQLGYIKFQQNGLNDNIRAAYNKYCRIIIEYHKTDKNNYVFKHGEEVIITKDLLYAVHKNIRQSCLRSGTPLIKLISIDGTNINGFPVLYYSYKRKGWEGKQPPVIVNVYKIFNHYESVDITFAYREAERETWKDIHNYIIKSFYFYHFL